MWLYSLTHFHWMKSAFSSLFIIVFFLHKLSQSKDASFSQKKSNRSFVFIFCILISSHQGLVSCKEGRRRNILSHYIWLDISISCLVGSKCIHRAVRATGLLNIYSRYYPDKEIIFWTIDGKTEAILCSIEVSRIQNIYLWYSLPISCFVFPLYKVTGNFSRMIFSPTQVKTDSKVRIWISFPVLYDSIYLFRGFEWNSGTWSEFSRRG